MDIDKPLLDKFVSKIKGNFSYHFQHNGAYKFLIINDSANDQEILVIDFTGIGIDITLDQQYFNCGNSASYNLKKLHERIELLMAIEQMLAEQKEIDDARAKSGENK